MTVRIGVHVHAQPRKLHATLAALRANTTPSAHIVLLPDEPDAETQAALACVTSLPQLGTDTPRGTAGCFNRLVTSGEADVYVLLESGSVVGSNWLEHLLIVLEADPQNGLAGPSTNRSWNEQGAFPRAGDSPTEIARTAQLAAQRFGSTARTLEPLYSLADFCYAVRREVVEAIGAADESYGQGPCWEMDYNIRAARAGWRGVWACAAYVWRAPFTARRQREETLRFEASKHRYQDKFCALRLRGERPDYERHCRGDACEHFAPTGLIQLTLPLPEPTPISSAAPAPSAVTVHPASAVRPVDSPPCAPAHGDAPLVTCIMPTRGRPDYVLQAVRYFQRQTYPARELLIIHEGSQDLPNDLPNDSRIRCVRMPLGASIGAKRNRACELAQGAIIAHWDDDDWYAPDRLAEQIAPLLAGQADITGLEAGVFFDLERWAFWRCTPELHRRLFVGDVHGGTLMFYRRVWERMTRYPDRSLAEDAIFLRSATQRGARLHKVTNQNIFVYLRHGSNAWSFATGHYLDSRAWLPVVEPPLPVEDRAFYVARSAAAHASAVVAVEAGPTKVDATFPSAAQVDGKRIAAAVQASPEREPAMQCVPVSLPLVSCIMPTYNRRHYVAQAILYFLRQDYPNRELIILDDGDDRVADLAPSDDRIRYVALDRRMILGAKRNLACEIARGQFIAHWDDDDWIAPRRLSYQCEVLQSAAADLCGAARQLYFDPANDRAWLYEYPLAQRRWLAGNTLLYRKCFWERNRFAEVQVGEDTRFVWSPQARNTVLTPDSDFYVGLIHAANTSPKSLNGPFWHSRPVSEIHRLLGDDLAFYRETPWHVRPQDISGTLLNSAVTAR